MGKFCSNCGAELNENAAVCVKCGVSVNNTATPTYTPIVKKQANTFCIIGFVLSIVSFFFHYIGIVVAVTSLVLSSIGLKQVSSNNTQSGKGIGIAGLIISIISILAIIDQFIMIF